MARHSKEKLNGLPPIDAQFEFRPEPEYAKEVLDYLLRFYTLDQIMSHSGLARRSLIDYKHTGFPRYSVQLTLEVLAGMRPLADG
jgi:hypothetical protein